MLVSPYENSRVARRYAKHKHGKVLNPSPQTVSCSSLVLCRCPCTGVSTHKMPQRGAPVEKPGVEDPSIHSTLRSTARSTGRRSRPGSAAIAGGRPTHETARHSRPGSAVVGGRSKVRGRTQSLVPVAHEVHTHDCNEVNQCPP